MRITRRTERGSESMFTLADPDGRHFSVYCTVTHQTCREVRGGFLTECDAVQYLRERVNEMANAKEWRMECEVPKPEGEKP